MRKKQNDVEQDIKGQEAASEPVNSGETVAIEEGADKAGAQVDRLGTASIGKLLLEFAIPATLSMVVNGLYNIISAIFLGQGVGDIGLAVSTVANPMMILFMALGMLVGTGGNALAAIRLGEGRKSEAERVMGNTVTLGVIVYLITVVIAYVFINPILTLSGATEATWDLSKMFIQILATGSIFQIIGMAINNFIRSAGDPKRALWTMIIGTIFCLSFSYLFVMVLGFGVPGQAAATIIGQIASFFFVMQYFTVNKKSPFKLRFKNLRLHGRTPLTILALGSASFLLQIAMTAVSFVLNNVIATYGPACSIGENGVFAAFAVVQRIAMFVMFPVMGITIAAQPLLGYNFGARNPVRTKKTLATEIKWAIICCVIMWVIIELCAPAICLLFGVSEQVMDFAIFTLRIQTAVMPLMVFQMVIASYYQSTGRPSMSIFLSLTRQLLIMTPLYICLPMLVPFVFPGAEQIIGVLFAPPTADFFSFVLAGIFTLIEFRKLNRAISLEEQGLPSGFGPSFKSDSKKHGGPDMPKGAPEAVEAAEVAEAEEASKAAGDGEEAATVVDSVAQEPRDLDSSKPE